MGCLGLRVFLWPNPWTSQILQLTLVTLRFMTLTKSCVMLKPLQREGMRKKHLHRCWRSEPLLTRSSHIATVAMNGDKEKAQTMIDGSVDSLNVDCHVQSLEMAAKRCGAFNDYSMRHSRLFANLCESVAVAQIETAVKQVCGGEVVV